MIIEKFEPLKGEIMVNFETFLKSLNLDEVRSSLDEEGVFICSTHVNTDFCREAIDFIETFKHESKTEINYGGSEYRVWDCQTKNESLNHFFTSCNQWVHSLTGGSIKPKTLLGIKNEALPKKSEELIKGRWHIDSFRSQIKVFLFLNPITEDSGAFEFIPRSHRPFFKLRMLSKGVYFKPTDFLRSKSRAYQSIDEKHIESLRQKGLRSRAVLSQGGTLMVVDTSSVHRARPCLKGARYALTVYYE